jgi:hypothetical protein
VRTHNCFAAPKFVWRLTLLCILAMVISFTASGQTVTRITGRITDQTGAVIPKATVTAHNELTNQDVVTITTSTGDFTFTNIRPGLYDVVATAPRFGTTTENAIHLVLDATVTVNLSLKPGSDKQNITVYADEVQLDQSKPDRGEVFNAEEIDNAPLNGNNPLSIAATQPGVVYEGAQKWQRPFDNYNMNLFSANGQDATGNDFQIDGTPDNAIAWGTKSIAAAPPAASISEMRVITNPYDAQYGHTGGAVFDMVTKYGTNNFHGQIFENMRRTWLRANTHLADTTGAAKGKSWVDQYGFETDGPLRIPHYYNGTDKTFFTLQYEGYRSGNPLTELDSVPPLSPGSTTESVAATGDFSADYYYDNGSNLSTIIYDNHTFDNTVNGVGVARDPFTDNIIPTSRLNATAQKILSYYPLPNYTTPAGSNWGIDNHLAVAQESDTNKSVIARVDQNFGPKDKAYLRFLWNKHFEYDPYTGITGAGKEGLALIRQNDSFSADWTHTFSPKLLLDFHLSYNRYVDNQKFGDSPFDLTNLGWPSTYNSTMPMTTFPEIAMSEYTYLGATSGPRETITNSVGGLPTLTWLHGAHTVKVGIDFRLMHNSAYQAGMSSGELYVARQWTQAHWWYWGGYAEGNSWASLLTGTADSGYVNDDDKLNVSFPYLAAYLQDDWKVTKRLTVNLGVRYDLQFPPTERHNQTVTDFDTTSINPVNATVASSLPTGVTLLGGNTYAGVNGNPRTFFNLDLLTLQPRVGFNFAVDSKTVVRGGIGTSYSTYSGYGNDQGFNQSTSYDASDNNAIWPNENVADPFPTIQKPTGSSLGLATEVGDSFTVSNRNFVSPGVLNYSLGVERQLNSHTTVDLSFVGSKGYHLDSTDNINHISEGFASQCNLENGASYTTYENCITYPSSDSDLSSNPEWVSNPFKGVTAFETAGNGLSYYTNSYLSASVYTRPFPEFGDITQAEQNQGQSVYNSVQLVVTHRWNNALTFHGSYVRSKLTDKGGYADTIYRIRLHYLDLGDRPNRYTFNGVWHLPVGRGRRFMANSNRLVDAAIGGWSLSPIYIWQNGVPEGIGLEAVKKQHSSHHREILNGAHVIRGSGHCVEWYNPNDNYNLAFASGSNTTGCTLGDPDFIVRPSYAAVQDYPYPGIREPNYQQMDVSLSKTFVITSKTKLDFRMDAYNALNHPTWDEGYNLDTSSSYFGTIDMDTTAQSNQPRDVQLSAKFIW